MTVSDPERPAGRQALLLIDFQNDFVLDQGRMPVARCQVGGAIAAAKEALSGALARRELVAAIGNAFLSNDWLGNFLRRRAAMSGSWGAQWDTRLPIAGLSYFSKWASDAFVNPALEVWLRDQGVTRVVLAGMFARKGVSSTARGAFRRGFQVRVLAAASACSSDASRTAAFGRLERMGARIERPAPRTAF